MKGSRTPEREAMLRAEYADAIDGAALLGRINALPGRPIPTSKALRVWACNLGLRKSEAAMRALYASWSAAGGDANSRRVWTPERIAMLRAEYSSTADTAALAKRIGALPGAPLGGRLSLTTKALRLGLAKTPVVHRAILSSNGKRGKGNLSSHPKTRTPERLALMQSSYAAAIDPTAFLAALNALPGPPFLSFIAVQSWAWCLRIRKTTEAIAAIRLRCASAGRSALARTPEAQEKRKANERAREERRQAKRAAEGYLKPKAPVIRRSTIPPPVRHEPDPVVMAGEQSPDIADQAVLRKHDMARRMLAKKIDADKVRATTGLPLREVFRLAYELRIERAGA